MGRDGWLGIGWPKEYGGQGRGHVEQFIFTTRRGGRCAPIPFLTINTVAQTIMEFGTRGAEASSSCRRSCAGELHFSIGYTEPQRRHRPRVAARPRAVKDGDEWVINGQKIYT